jgi:hypothetical protein
MNIKLTKLQLVALVASVLFSGAINANAQYGGFGFGIGYFPSQDRSLGAAKLSADSNYDGFLDVMDADVGINVKRNPPGLIVGTHELTRIDLSVIHNASRQTSSQPGSPGSPKLKFLYYKTAAILDLRPINLGHRRGNFKSFEEEQSRAGRMRIWLDASRTTLLLDSADSGKRRVEWPASSSLPPKHVYAEGVSVGDSGTVMMLTLLLDNNNLSPTADKLFGEKACWDAMMLSIWPSPKTKPYIDKSIVWKRF